MTDVEGPAFIEPTQFLQQIEHSVREDGVYLTKACGFLIARQTSPPNATQGIQVLMLLRRDGKGYDIPKGHVDTGEVDEHSTALRELQEETGIEAHQLEIDPHFRHEEAYEVYYGPHLALKTVIYFLAFLKPQFATNELFMTEHTGYLWVDWPFSSTDKHVHLLLLSLQQHALLYPPFTSLS